MPKNQSRTVGIVSYGSYLPSLRISSEQIALGNQSENLGASGLGVVGKTVPAVDEDAITMAVSAGAQALERMPKKNSLPITALYMGSESHPYAVKPSISVVKQALGLSEEMFGADLQFACKAGTASLQIGYALILANMVKAAMAIGSDTAQSKPGDVLEFTAGAGAAAFVIGEQSVGTKVIAKIVDTISVATDTPDFWRRPGQKYPEHAGRFSGEPGYFYHVELATQKILSRNKMQPRDFDHVIFHTPNAKFPQQVAQKLGFTPPQLKNSLMVKNIGNTYAAASLIALVNVLDHAQPNQKILLTSYGSGAGADSLIFETTPWLAKERQNWTNLLEQQELNKNFIDYQTYRRYVGLEVE